MVQHQIGSIASIKLENFVTYSNISLRPGPHLNLIMGPNGTGKSTIICAIIIGLGGNPNVIGRATSLNAYVRQGEAKASIQIELVGSQHNAIITRTFTIDGKNLFQINGKSTSAKEVQGLCKKFNIQVDNLCQFLPQDRVQDFAKLNAQELLLSTQRTLTNCETWETHQELITLRKEYLLLTQATDKLDEQLRSEEKANERLENIVSNIEKQDELKDELKIATIRLYWLQYEQSREKLEEVQQDRRVAQNNVNKYTTKLEPLEKAWSQLKKQVAEKNNNLSTMRRALQAEIAKLQDLQEALDQQQQSIINNKNNLEEKYKQFKGKEQEIMVLERLLDSTKLGLVETVGEYQTRETLINKISSVSEEISKFSKKINDLESKRTSIVTDLNNSVNAEIRLCQQNLTQIQNVSARRLDILRQLNGDAYKATMWLKENEQMFRAKVYSPMIIELNMKNPDHAKYLENTVSNRDLIAFTCELPEDVNLMIKKVKNEMRLKINVVHSSPGNLASYIPRVSIDSIRRFGFFSYLLGLVEGPEPILSYLCKTYQIHRIPIGSSKTNELSDEIPAEFSLFFSDKFRYNIKVSHYTGEKSTATIQISDGKLLSQNIDLAAQEKYQNRLQQLIRSSDDLKNNISIIETSMRQVDEQKSRAMAEKKQMQDRKSKMDNLLQQLKRQKTTISKLKSEHFDMDEEKSAFYKTVSETADSILKIHEEILKRLANLNNKNIEKTGKLLEHLTQLVNEKEYDMSDIKDKLQDSENQLKNVAKVYERVKIEAKTRYNEALQLSDNLPPDHPNFPNKTEFDNLPTDVDVLNDLMGELQSRINGLNVGDGNTYEDYMQRKKLIENLTKHMRNDATRSAVLLQELESKGTAWSTKVEELISKIRENFGRYMAYLDCAGDVTLTCGPDKHDYEQYGISIKVKYRRSEALQELNRFTQSGGERAVATAIYLLSLQELTDAPFRCLDEINQGMDHVNERRIFELLVKCTSQDSSPQYFLLTPKLLPNLPYSENVTVNIINKGIVDVPNDCTRNIIDEILKS